jgi:hypothetical protein
MLGVAIVISALLCVALLGTAGLYIYESFVNGDQDG